jgi:hypothetical protein
MILFKRGCWYVKVEGRQFKYFTSDEAEYYHDLFIREGLPNR